MTSVDLPSELDARLEALAQATGRRKVDCLTEAVESYLVDCEDVAVAEARLAAIRSGKEDTVSLADLLARYGVAD